MTVPTDQEINALIADAINALILDSPEKASEALTELAHLWARATLPQSSFADLRRYIVSEAMSKTSQPFIEEKLRIAEQIQRSKRHATSKTD